MGVGFLEVENRMGIFNFVPFPVNLLFKLGCWSCRTNFALRSICRVPVQNVYSPRAFMSSNITTEASKGTNGSKAYNSEQIQVIL